MNRAGQAHLFQPCLQRLPTPVKADRDVVQGDAKVFGDSIARLLLKIDAPDYFGIFRSERRQQLVQTIAYRLVEFFVEPVLDAVQVGWGHDYLPLAPSRNLATVVGDGRRQNLAEPATNGAHIALALSANGHELIQHLFQ